MLDRSTLLLISGLRITLELEVYRRKLTKRNRAKYQGIMGSNLLTRLNEQETEWISWDIYLIFYNTYILNSGNCWYFWNSASHSSWLVGGFISFIKCQSTIERPDSVNLRKGKKFERGVGMLNDGLLINSLWQQVDLKVNVSLFPNTFLFSYCLEF